MNKYPEDDKKFKDRREYPAYTICNYPNCTNEKAGYYSMLYYEEGLTDACKNHLCRCIHVCIKSIIYDTCERNTCLKCYATIYCVCKCKKCDIMHSYISAKNFDNSKLPDDLLNLVIRFSGLQVIDCPILKFF